MREIWNTRYNSEEYIYGLKPNEFLKSFIENKNPGNILLPADGEGRNSIFAAKLGWNVDAFDFSESAQLKALRLAKENKVEINYSVSDVLKFKTENTYNTIALIYIHLPQDIRSPFFKKLVHLLKPGGYIVLEAFSKKQLQNKSGGPKDLNLLYSVDEIASDFKELSIELIEEKQIFINEGSLHHGKADVVRLLARKY